MNANRTESRNVVVRLLVGTLSVATATLNVGASGFLHIPDVPGEATASHYERWIDVEDVVFAVARTNGLGHGASRVSSLCAVKRVDRSTPLLAHAVCSARHFEHVRLTLKRNDNLSVTLYEIDLHDVVVDAAQLETVGDGAHLRERVCLSYSRMVWSYTEVLRDNPDYPFHPIWSVSIGWDAARQEGETSEIFVDTDGDGMPDFFEIEYGLDPFVDDAHLDADGDYLTNSEEYRAGTDPTDPNSVFRLSAVSQDGVRVRLTWLSAAGKTYRVSRADAIDGDYVFLATVPSAGEGETSNEFDDPLGMGFYRVTVSP